MEDIKKKLFQVLKPNTCPICGHDSLWLIEYECTMSRLNEQGMPTESYVDDHQMKLKCATCSQEFDNIMKSGMCFKVGTDLPPVRKVMKDFNPFQIVEKGDF